MVRSGIVRTVAVLAVAVVTMAGCGSGSDDSADSNESSVARTSPTDQDAPPAETEKPGTPTAQPGTPTNQAEESDGFSEGVDALRDGVWQVGDAGEVEFTLADGTVSLVEVRPSEGWEYRISDEQSDELTVHFTRGMSDWKFEVEIDDSTMEISKELTLRNAAAGTYLVGSAAEVSFDGDGSAVTAGKISPRPGWQVTARDEGSTDLEIEFRNDAGGKAEFEVEADRGEFEVEIHQKLTGLLPG